MIKILQIALILTNDCVLLADCLIFGAWTLLKVKNDAAPASWSEELKDEQLECDLELNCA